jgi:hypothetical protein
VNRRELQELARLRTRESRALLQGGFWDGAYYLCGYAVECALIACIARQVRRHDFPDRERTLQSYSHDLAQLVRVAGLERQLQVELGGNPALAGNWAIVKVWAERSRYERRREQEARALYAATADRRNGVLRWIGHYW